jgi:amidase
MPWRSNVLEPKDRKLRFGIISDNDGEISVYPPIVRGTAMTKAALEAAGHDVFEWKPTDHEEIVKELNTAFATLGGAAIVGLQYENGEPVYPSMSEYEVAYNKGEEGTLGPTKLRGMIVRRNALQKKYLDRWMATAGDGKGPMDAIICPSSPWTAPRLGITQKVFCVNYTGVWNLLGLLHRSCIHPYFGWLMWDRLLGLHISSHICRSEAGQEERELDASE